MAERSEPKEVQPQRVVTVTNGSYGLAFIGALIYFLQQATSFGDGLLGVCKAILWPAFLIYRLLEFLKM